MHPALHESAMLGAMLHVRHVMRFLGGLFLRQRGARCEQARQKKTVHSHGLAHGVVPHHGPSLAGPLHHIPNWPVAFTRRTQHFLMALMDISGAARTAGREAALISFEEDLSLPFVRS